MREVFEIVTNNIDAKKLGKKIEFLRKKIEFLRKEIEGKIRYKNVYEDMGIPFINPRGIYTYIICRDI